MKFEQKNLAHVGTRTPVSMHKRLDLITKDQEGTNRQARLMKSCSRPLYIGVRNIRISSAIGSCGRTPEAAVKKIACVIIDIPSSMELKISVGLALVVDPLVS
jgi:hypothetical protein